jgi:hypothetical protein
MAQATVPTSRDKEFVDKVGTLLAKPIFARHQWHAPETLLQPINLNRHPLGICILLFIRTGAVRVFVSLNA